MRLRCEILFEMAKHASNVGKRRRQYRGNVASVRDALQNGAVMQDVKDQIGIVSISVTISLRRSNVGGILTSLLLFIYVICYLMK